jgi:hypothetical protein
MKRETQPKLSSAGRHTLDQCERGFSHSKKLAYQRLLCGGEQCNGHFSSVKKWICKMINMRREISQSLFERGNWELRYSI